MILSKMKKTLFLLILAVYTLPGFAQEINPTLIGKKFTAAISLEEKLKAKVYTSDDDIIIPGGMAAPIVYIRPNGSHENFYIQYTFSEQDSVIQHIEYRWGDDNDKKHLISKYELFLKSFNKRYGKAEAVGEYQCGWISKAQLEFSLYGNFGDEPFVSVGIRKKD